MFASKFCAINSAVPINLIVLIRISFNIKDKLCTPYSIISNDKALSIAREDPG